MTWSEFLLTVHILAAIVWLGGSIMLLVLGYQLRRSGTAQSRIDFTRMTEKVASMVFAPASILLIVAGSLLVDELGYEYDQAWIVIGYVGWFISFLLGVGFYAQEGKRREALIGSGGLDHPGVLTSLDRVLRVATVDTTIITLVVLAMTTKPGL